MADPFAAIRRRVVEGATLYSVPEEHLEHQNTTDVFKEKPQFSAAAHPEHREHHPEPEGLRMRDLAHLPQHWTDAMRSLAQSPVPSCARPERWRQIIKDAAAFLLGWHDIADEHGWTVGHVFGMDPDEPSGAIGLAMSIKGGKVRRLFVDERGRHVAQIARGRRTRSYSEQFMLTHRHCGRSPIWSKNDEGSFGSGFSERCSGCSMCSGTEKRGFLGTPI